MKMWRMRRRKRRRSSGRTGNFNENSYTLHVSNIQLIEIYSTDPTKKLVSTFL
jgi:hypothetical protein